MGGGAKMYYTEITRREDLEVLLVQLERYSLMFEPAREKTDTWLFPFYLRFDSAGLRYYYIEKYKPGRSFSQLTATQFLNKAKEMFPKSEPAEKFNFFKLGRFEFELITNADMPENEFEMVSGNGEKLRVKCAESVTTCTPAKDGFCGEEGEAMSLSNREKQMLMQCGIAEDCFQTHDWKYLYQSAMVICFVSNIQGKAVASLRRCISEIENAGVLDRSHYSYQGLIHLDGDR
jgi:hypothetical protein